MPNTPPLFEGLEPNPKPASSAAALSLSAKTQAPKSAPARAFDVQLSRVSKLKSQLQELDALEQSHRLAMHQQLTPVQARYRLAMRNMALLLDQRLDGKALSPLQRDTATQILCSLAGALGEQGDAEMAALHDKRSPQTLGELEQADAAQLRAQIEELLGEPLDATLDEASLEELLAAGMERVRQTLAADEEARRAAAAKRKAKKKPHAAQAGAQLQEAESSLRKLFRQLASSLHPDREPDAQARLAKTALMSEANAAYERRDLVALLQIQQKALGADAQAAALMSEDKLAEWTLLIKQQVADLERERAARSERLAAEFELAPGFKLTAFSLQAALHQQVVDLEHELALMQRDLQLVQDDAALKRWLNEQAKETRRQMRAAARMGFA
jgi:hypothetical protein